MAKIVKDPATNADIAVYTVIESLQPGDSAVVECGRLFKLDPDTNARIPVVIVEGENNGGGGGGGIQYATTQASNEGVNVGTPMYGIDTIPPADTLKVGDLVESEYREFVGRVTATSPAHLEQADLTNYIQFGEFAEAYVTKEIDLSGLDGVTPAANGEINFLSPPLIENSIGLINLDTTDDITVTTYDSGGNQVVTSLRAGGGAWAATFDDAYLAWDYATKKLTLKDTLVNRHIDDASSIGSDTTLTDAIEVSIEIPPTADVMVISSLQLPPVPEASYPIAHQIPLWEPSTTQIGVSEITIAGDANFANEYLYVNEISDNQLEVYTGYLKTDAPATTEVSIVSIDEEHDKIEDAWVSIKNLDNGTVTHSDYVLDADNETFTLASNDKLEKTVISFIPDPRQSYIVYTDNSVENIDDIGAFVAAHSNATGSTNFSVNGVNKAANTIKEAYLYGRVSVRPNFLMNCFYQCTNFEQLDIDLKLNNNNNETNLNNYLRSFLYGCTKFNEAVVNLPKLPKSGLENVTTMNYYCRSVLSGCTTFNQAATLPAIPSGMTSLQDLSYYLSGVLYDCKGSNATLDLPAIPSGMTSVTNLNYYCYDILHGASTTATINFPAIPAGMTGVTTLVSYFGSAFYGHAGTPATINFPAIPSGMTAVTSLNNYFGSTFYGYKGSTLAVNFPAIPAGMTAVTSLTNYFATTFRDNANLSSTISFPAFPSGMTGVTALSYYFYNTFVSCPLMTNALVSNIPPCDAGANPTISQCTVYYAGGTTVNTPATPDTPITTLAGIRAGYNYHA
ncbi:hypothetical protein AGMMS4956_14210 [Bacteroidia bacterium]|nr:hypothetical protein AGMMS4956_14210 [Bacteroidia bacterium]